MKDKEPSSIAFQYYKKILRNYCEEWEDRLRHLQGENDYLKSKINNLERNQQKVFSVLNKVADNASSRIIPREKRYEVLRRQKWNCNQCGCKLKYSKESKWEGKIAHIDHIWPYSKKEEYPRGEILINELENLQGLCPQCNLKKSNKKTY